MRAESPVKHSAQGKRSDTLGPPVLKQSRPERAKALNVCVRLSQDSNNLVYEHCIFPRDEAAKNAPTRDASPPLEVALSGSVGCLRLSQNGIIKQHKTQALMGATRLASVFFNSLVSGKDAAIISRVRNE